MESMADTRSRCNPYMPFRKCNSSDFLEKCQSSQTREMTCEMTVAQAEPLMPQPQEKMKRGFRAQLMTTEARVAYIAILGWPEERRRLFKPR